MFSNVRTVIVVAALFVCALAARGQDDAALEFHLDFESDDAVDESGNGRDGAVVGGPSIVPGVVGSAWDFDGGVQIDLNDQMFKDPDVELSIRVWLFPSDLDTMRTIYDEGGAWTGFTVRIMDGALEFATVCCDAAHPPPEVISVDYTEDDDWAEVAAVFGQGQMLLYVNGALVGQQPTDWAELGAHGQAGVIGNVDGDSAFGGGSGFYVGLMDEFRVYSRMLDADELSLSVSPGAADVVTTWGRLRRR